MNATIDPAKREAALPDGPLGGPVTLINSFVVESGRDDKFYAAWSTISAYFRRQPGFLSLRLHRALSPDAPYRFVNVANWASAEEFRAAHATDTFRQLVSVPEMAEFPSSPALYGVFTEYAV